jgi:hypothetical protein
MRTRQAGESALLLLDAVEVPDLALVRKLAAAYGPETLAALEHMLAK